MIYAGIIKITDTTSDNARQKIDDTAVLFKTAV